MLPALCDEARSGRLRIAPAFVWVTSEPLLPELRKMIEAKWNAPLLNTWVSSESIGASFPCTSGTGFHVAEDLTIIEPVDERGRRVAPGTLSAKILVTNLHNHLMPLVRYEISDQFQVSTSGCGCGVHYLKMEDVPGRLEDIFEYERGVRIHPITFDSVLGKEPSVHEYRVKQTEYGAHVEIISPVAVDIDRLRGALETCLVSSGLRDPQVQLRRVDSLRGHESGKLKRFVSLSRYCA
jgi:phenylacetate-coenzyme A ligase PaaK-like adenylate-forming protein